MKQIKHLEKYYFKKGDNKKPKKLFWDKDWLEKEMKTKSVSQIAKEQGAGRHAIYKWIRKYFGPKEKGFCIKYWWDTNKKQFSVTLHQDGIIVNSGHFKQETSPMPS